MAQRQGDSQFLPVSAQRRSDYPARSGLVGGYHLYSNVPVLAVSGGGDGQVQPVCAKLGDFHYARIGVLCGGIETGPGFRQTGDFQYGSGQPVYIDRLYGYPAEGRFYRLCVKGICPFQAELIHFLRSNGINQWR